MELSMQLRCDCRATRAPATEAATTSDNAEAAADAEAAEHGDEEQRSANGNVKHKGCAAKRSAAVRPRGGEVAAARRHRREALAASGEEVNTEKRN